ncbi:MAG TPA: hypothetical protein VGJ93_02380 [Desulfuromonadaceae bacterium]|jgi:hypothetical protein
MNRVSVFLVAGLATVTLLIAGVDAADKNSNSFAGYSTDIRKDTRGTDLDEACACCMACRAATKDVKPEDDGVPATDGCRDCCERCGTENLPLDKNRIPEKIK